MKLNSRRSLSQQLLFLIVYFMFVFDLPCSHYSDDPSELPMNALTRDDFLYPMPLDIEEKKDEVPISLWMGTSSSFYRP